MWLAVVGGTKRATRDVGMPLPGGLVPWRRSPGKWWGAKLVCEQCEGSAVSYQWLNAKQNPLLIKDTRRRQSVPCLGESPAKLLWRGICQSCIFSLLLSHVGEG